MSDKEKAVSDALETLDKAAQENRSELSNMVAGKYEALKEIIFREGAIKDGLLATKNRAMGAAHQVRGISEEKAKELAGAIDDSVRKHPWPYLGGVAVGALLLGFVLGKKNS